MLDDSTETRWRNWRRALSSNASEARFAARLRRLGWSQDEARAKCAVGCPSIFREPDWDAALLARGIALFESGGDAVNAPVPFAELACPLARVAVVDGSEGFSPDVVVRVSGQLARVVSQILAPSLLGELPSLSRFIPGPPRREPYDALILSLRSGGFRAHLTRYPVLARILGVTLTHWRDSLREFTQRLVSDLPEIEARFGRTGGHLLELDWTLGDPHEAGRRVAGLHFESGLRLVYKPRRMGADAAWSRLLRWIATHDGDASAHVPAVIDRDSYGWVEWIESGPTTDPHFYYRQAGRLLAAAWLCGATDLHEENLIATPYGPVVVDLETLFLGVSRAFGLSEEEMETSHALGGESFSVLSTFLLPVWQVDLRGRFRDQGGLTGCERSDGAWREPTWVNLGTDQLRQEMRPALSRPVANLPRDPSGVVLSAREFLDDLVLGFQNAMRHFLDQREAVPMEAFRGAPTRFLLRNTDIYASMQRRLLETPFLGSAVDRTIELEKLARPFFSPHTHDPIEAGFRCYEAERIAMERNDVPVFRAANDSTTLVGDGGVEVAEFFWRPGWPIAVERLAVLDEATIEEQSALIRNSLRLRVHAQKHPSGRDLLGAALEIAGDLGDRALPLRKGGVSWLAPGLDSIQKSLNAAVLGLDLYSGTLGVAVFLSALARVSGQERWADLARSATRPTLDRLRMPESRSGLGKMPGGLSNGIGSLVYGCLVLADLLDDPGYQGDAVYFSEFLNQTDCTGDVLGGGAGAILALLAIGTPSALETATPIGRALLDARILSSTGHRVWSAPFASAPLSGFGHGAAGYACALGLLGHATGVAAFSEAAVEAIAYETAVFDAEAQNWPDFRTDTAGPTDSRRFMYGWCSGPAGIGLARIRQSTSGGPLDDFALRVAIHDALNGHPLSSKHLCCGEAARIELLLHAAEKVGDHALYDAAKMRAMNIVDSRGREGWYVLNGADRGKIFAPSFFQGLSGIGYTYLRVLDPSLPAVASFQTKRIFAN